jgi:hypothetical protein
VIFLSGYRNVGFYFLWLQLQTAFLLTMMAVGPSCDYHSLFTLSHLIYLGEILCSHRGGYEDGWLLGSFAVL